MVIERNDDGKYSGYRMERHKYGNDDEELLSWGEFFQGIQMMVQY